MNFEIVITAIVVILILIDGQTISSHRIEPFLDF